MTLQQAIAFVRAGYPLARLSSGRRFCLKRRLRKRYVVISGAAFGNPGCLGHYEGYCSADKAWKMAARYLKARTRCVQTCA